MLAELARAIGGKEGDMVVLSLRRVDGDVLFVEEDRPSGAPVAAQLELLTSGLVVCGLDVVQA